MVEHVLVEQVGLVEEEDGVHAVAAEVLDVAGHREEDGGGAGGGGQAQGETELAVEVAAPEGGVVAVREAEAGRRESVAKRAQDAGLADAGLAGERDGGALVEGFDERPQRRRAWTAVATGRRRRSPWRTEPGADRSG
jgi:hypothetical protein